MRSAEAALEESKRYFREEVAPKAQLIDQDPAMVAEAMRGLCERDLMALKRPAKFGGPEMSEPMFREYQEEIARTSGALAFLTTQHQSAVAMLSSCENQDLAAEYLPQMGDGGKLVGIGFSQLRRGGPPIMRAEPVDGGYRLEGHVPWITGGGLFPEFMIGAALPDGRSVFGIVPLEDREREIKVSPPMRLAAMESANTVSAEFSGFFLPKERVAYIRPPNWIKNNDQINVALQGHFALGCAQAGIDIVRQAGEKKGISFLTDAAAALEQELADCHVATAEAQKSVDEETTDERLRVRAWAIELAVRCAHAAIAASSGAANSLSHPAQRVYREALVYTVSAQTTAVMEATVRRLRR
ncbi:acyl-CoA dehydrogenase family protein [Fimbriimonas ginsengisoli]|uniref:Acyl-CoA dehydrogenase family protein n=1 Tax=Fimbriimonas ginsengisoli Gsoil 348 TaxID=661478 RepID=A0A068NVM7_FIMGI|nr:acyl-CoA dehydrogenase family protein [Fimbriimonas ginsengisoli]AIE85639.1 acyl-CoA dehydrogenase family protein [Fimbriimonas ginsengisoli Gsoil 348]